MKRLTEIMKQVEQPKILDIGTGSGQFINLMTEACDHYSSMTGIDMHEKGIEAAAKHFKDERISFEVKNVFDVKETYDVVCLSNSLHHFDEPEAIVNKMIEMTNKDGYIVIMEMYRDNQTEAQMTHVGLHHFWASVDRELGVPHNDTYTKKEILETLNHSSLKVLDSWDFEFEDDPGIKPEDYSILKNSIYNSLKRVEGHDVYDDMKKTGEVLEKRIDDVGFALATEFMVILKKC